MASVSTAGRSRIPYQGVATDRGGLERRLAHTSPASVADELRRYAETNPRHA